MNKALVLKLVGLLVDNAVMLLGGAAVAYRFHDKLVKVVGPVVYFVEEYVGKIYGLFRGPKKNGPAASGTK